MGHIDWGLLPRTPAWNRVVAHLQVSQIDVPATAQATVRAAERRLVALQGDPSLSYCIWLLLRLATAARSDDFRGQARQIGLDPQSGETALDFIAQVADVTRERLRHHPESGPFGEMAALALRRALTETVGMEGRSLFGGSVDDLERAFRRHSMGTQFGLLAKRYFADVFARIPHFYVDRELANAVVMPVFPHSRRCPTSARLSIAMPASRRRSSTASPSSGISRSAGNGRGPSASRMRKPSRPGRSAGSARRWPGRWRHDRPAVARPAAL